MQRLTNNCDSYNLKNCFGFSEIDNNDSFIKNTSVINKTTGSVEFQTNKPYRLALYVRPSERRKLNTTNSYSLLKDSNQRISNKSKPKCDSKSSVKVKEKVQTKITRSFKRLSSVMLFDENIKPENDAKRLKCTPEKSNTDLNETNKSVYSSRKKVLTEVNSKPLTKTRQCKTRKSYERKYKLNEPEIVFEEPSSKIIQEMEVQKLSKTKIKKPAKEDKEFEKWANDINSDFDDVDKFELSIAYD